jgi:hypothetical protein
VVALMAIPSLGAFLLAHGGPALAALAEPAWLPVSWVLRGGELVVAAALRR